MTATTNPVAPGAETPATMSNDKRRNELDKLVVKFGEESSLGKDSLPKLAHAVVKAAAEGVIDLATKNAKGEDAAHQLYTAYAKGESKKAIHEHSAGGFKGNVSKLRQLISMGCMTTIDAPAVMQEAYEAREGMKKEEGVKVKPAYVFYVDVAREQAKTDKALTRRDLEAIAMKDGPNDLTVEGEIKKAMAVLEKLISGENRSKVKDTHADTEAAYNLLKGRLATMVQDAKRRELLAQAAKLGLKLA